MARSESLKRGFVSAWSAGDGEEPWGCWLEGDGSQSVSLWGFLEWKKFLSAVVVVGSCHTCLAAVPVWEVALGMLRGASVRQGFGEETFIPIYGGV